MLSDPVLANHEGFLVVRDDLLPGGTKRRALHVLFDNREEYVYASPVYGYAQVALAYAARDAGKRAAVFCAERKVWAPLTWAAAHQGALIHEVPHGYMSVVRARARAYCAATGAALLPFGLDDPRFIEALANVARGIGVQPAEVWCVAGSGVLTRALQLAWPEARHNVVRVGAEPDAGRAKVFVAPEKYEQAARNPPPWPACANYDAKLWSFVRGMARPGALVWNVAA